ncbi:hypothetical protein GCM10025876_10480 [Demequina litorisediminis]|uniref:CMP/dCMP-type deaminase domain-containing protein n=1 Tax=Demequina litorisediminis TaxID=1849022 RepID=A0ABQ6IDN7_9MICO|nr:hypothetical protein GCM10025876_10480 [Demequina litorisediminis]
MPEIDWDALRSAAREATTRAYVPYSHFPVGVAALTDTGEIVIGANVENASYGLTLCAECALVSKAPHGWCGLPPCRVHVCGRRRRGARPVWPMPSVAL